MTSVYYKYAIAAIIVYDLSRPATFEAITKWKDDLNSKVMLANKQPIPTLLLANKCDIPGVIIDEQFLEKFVVDNGFIGWFQTSAQQNTNIDQAMKFLIGKILEVAATNDVVRPEANTIVQLGQQQEEIQPKKKENRCCP